MFPLGSAAFAEDVALIVTFFVAIGLIVNALVVYIIGQVLAERRENQERRERGI
jgi:phage shock protein PspC (stress-responsive transcriptional regulator)